MGRWTDEEWRAWDVAREVEIWNLAARDNAVKLRDLRPLEAGVADAQDHSGWTPLQVAALKNSAKAASALLELGADVSMRCGYLEPTALHLAAWHGHTEVMRVLLDHKADSAAGNGLGELAIEKARQRGMKEAETLLLLSGSPDPGIDVTSLQVANEHALTARATAASRAVESDRPDNIFFDPLAHRLAGKEGMAYGGGMCWILTPRTSLGDECVKDAYRRGVRQVVLLGAGMDARAYRLGFGDMTFYEVDQQAIFDVKEPLLQGLEPPSAARVPVVADLCQKDALVAGLRAAGFSPQQPSCWLLEGLVMYLSPSHVDNLFAAISSLTSPGSVVFHDAVSETSQQGGIVCCGARFLSGSDDYAGLWRSHGFNADVVDFKQTYVDRQQRRVLVEPGRMHPSSVTGRQVTFFVWAAKM
eukprot:TRINITY_DN60647_c0_g1_i1.p1 TRINITY_DN60647_c0_g1~~TRINITY_DN60647_c0_g1_i1.p1  ORF type:complete len:438 (-),score=88.74 TRINITY_DN60647_c0_g1_i1:39-1286(-)